MQEPSVAQNKRVELHLQLLGGFTVQVGETMIGEAQWKSRRARNLVKLLALAPGHRLHRDQIIDTLWPDADLSAAANSLHQTLFTARRILDTLAPGCLTLDEGFLSLSGGEGQVLSVDVDQFETAAAKARGSQDPQVYQSGLALYSGELLPEDRYEEWAVHRRDTLHQAYLQLLLNLAHLQESLRDYLAGIGTLLRLLAADPSHEEAHAGLMRLYALSGRRQQALRQYQTLREVLEIELDAEPSPSTRQLYEAIQSGQLGVEAPVSLPIASTRHHNLPVQLTSFVGREHEIVEVSRLIIDHRLVTLTGSGGTGKTRLALRAVEGLLETFPDGVFFIELASLSDQALVPQICAHTLELVEQPNIPIQAVLAHYLEKKRLLLILDNCEHVISACTSLADSLLKACPQLHILATSREGLGVSGEVLWDVPPLSLPAQQPWTDPASVEAMVNRYMESESVQLFLTRVSAVSPGFTLSGENGPWVAEICRRLDGMPLAIELAAARVRALSVKQIAERLDDRFHLLSAGSHTAPPRQQTLVAALDWSYELLTEAERRVFQRLSVFAGGASLEAAEAVCACEWVRPQEVLGVLAHLVDKSLVSADQSAADARYRMLETIRQYALQKLTDRGDEQACRDCHLNYFVHWAETIAPSLFAPDKLLELRQFEVEHDNLRAALDWSSTHEGQARAGLRLAAACGNFWTRHSHFSEGRQRLAAALSLPQAQDGSAVQASAMMHAAQLAYLQADYPSGQPLVEQALAIWRELGSEGQAGLARTLELYGGFRMEVGDYANAVRLFQESLDRYTQLQDIGGMGELHKDLGWCAMRTGDYRLAQTHLQQDLLLAQESGDKHALNYAYSGLGEVAVRLGQYPRAARLLAQGLALSREQGDRWMEATILGSLGWEALRQRQFDRMRDWLGESLSLRMGIGDQGGIAWCLEKLAEAAILEGQPHQAAKIFASAAALRSPLQSVIDPADMQDYERMLSGLRSRLDPAAYQALCEAGQAMPLKDVVGAALSAPAQTGAASVSDKVKYQGLSKRERETAGWIAQGKSNREIARAMTVGEKTVETYVTRILNKLGFDSRVQIAVWAVEKDLVSPQNS